MLVYLDSWLVQASTCRQYEAHVNLSLTLGQESVTRQLLQVSSCADLDKTLSQHGMGFLHSDHLSVSRQSSLSAVQCVLCPICSEHLPAYVEEPSRLTQLYGSAASIGLDMPMLPYLRGQPNIPDRRSGLVDSFPPLLTFPDSVVAQPTTSSLPCSMDSAYPPFVCGDERLRRRMGISGNTGP